MIEFCSSLFSNLLGNLVFWAGGGVLVWLVLSRKRRALWRFFGLSRGTDFMVYLSSYSISPDSVKDRLGVPSGHQGKAIPESEFQTIPPLSSILGRASPFYAPDLFAGLIDGFWASRMPRVRFEPSPDNEKELELQSMICVGGPKFNTATAFYMRTENCFLRHYKDEGAGRWRIAINRGARKDEVIGSDLGKDEVDIGYVQRVRDSQRGTVIIIAAGLGVNGTRAAVHYLVQHWHELERQHGDRDFGVVFKCPDAKKDKDGFRSIVKLLKLLG